MTTAYPHSPEAEDAFLGAALLNSEAVEWGVESLTPTDFFEPFNQAAFSAICNLYYSGHAVDTTTLFTQMQSDGHADSDTLVKVVALMSKCSSRSAYRSYGATITEHALRRSLMASGLELVEQARNGLMDIGDVLDGHTAALRNIDSPLIVRDAGDVSFEEFAAAPIAETLDWIVPGVLARDWRIMLVAPEGVGKSVVQRQIAICARYGIHPFTHQDQEPKRVLICDFENPTRAIRRTTDPIMQTCERYTRRVPEEGSGRIWRKQEGIDLRKRVGRIEFEDVIRRHRPDVVVCGPLYKMYDRKSGDSYEEIASEVQHVIDDLRTRYEFGFIVEHHQAKGAYDATDRGGPEGSSLWLRWSELGLKLLPPNRSLPVQEMNVIPFRGARDDHDWPKRIYRGTEWLWEADWKGNMHTAA